MHVLTVGNSGTGKSNLNKRLACDALARGHAVIVFDPLKAGGWPTGINKYASAEQFLLAVESAESAHVFVDEAKILWDHDFRRADRLLYNRRHQGLLVYLIAQRTRMVPPNARNQCSRVFAFRQQKQDADILAEEYHDALEQCRALAPGQFIFSDGFNLSRGELEYASPTSKIPPKINMLKIP